MDTGLRGGNGGAYIWEFIPPCLLPPATTTAQQNRFDSFLGKSWEWVCLLLLLLFAPLLLGVRVSQRVVGGQGTFVLAVSQSSHCPAATLSRTRSDEQWYEQAALNGWSIGRETHRQQCPHTRYFLLNRWESTGASLFFRKAQTSNGTRPETASGSPLLLPPHHHDENQNLWAHTCLKCSFQHLQQRSATGKKQSPISQQPNQNQPSL